MHPLRSLSTPACCPLALALTLTPNGRDGYVHRLELVVPSDDSSGGSGRRLATVASPAKRVAAKFLTHATFGPTTYEVNALSATLSGVSSGVEATAAFAAWIDGQMSLPPSLHRAYYRRRTNPRLLGPRAMVGSLRPACSEGSRWARYALSMRDVWSAITVSQATDSDGSPTLRIVVGGDLRAELPLFEATSLGFETLGVGPGAPFTGYVRLAWRREGYSKPPPPILVQAALPLLPIETSPTSFPLSLPPSSHLSLPPLPI